MKGRPTVLLQIDGGDREDWSGAMARAWPKVRAVWAPDASAAAGWTRSRKSDATFPTFAGWEALPEALSRADTLVNLLPSTPDTRRLTTAATSICCRSAPPSFTPGAATRWFLATC
jgi:hypothetical protein